MLTYGQTIRWTDRNGAQSVSVSGCETPQEAYDRVIAFARDAGWTPPRWWQFWRYGDTQPISPASVCPDKIHHRASAKCALCGYGREEG